MNADVASALDQNFSCDIFQLGIDVKPRIVNISSGAGNRNMGRMSKETQDLLTSIDSLNMDTLWNTKDSFLGAFESALSVGSLLLFLCFC